MLKIKEAWEKAKAIYPELKTSYETVKKWIQRGILNWNIENIPYQIIALDILRSSFKPKEIVKARKFWLENERTIEDFIAISLAMGVKGEGEDSEKLKRHGELLIRYGIIWEALKRGLINAPFKVHMSLHQSSEIEKSYLDIVLEPKEVEKVYEKTLEEVIKR